MSPDYIIIYVNWCEVKFTAIRHRSEYDNNLVSYQDKYNDRYWYFNIDLSMIQIYKLCNIYTIAGTFRLSRH